MSANKAWLVHIHSFSYGLWMLSNGRIKYLKQRPYGLQSLKIYYTAFYINSLPSPGLEQNWPRRGCLSMIMSNHNAMHTTINTVPQDCSWYLDPAWVLSPIPYLTVKVSQTFSFSSRFHCCSSHSHQLTSFSISYGGKLGQQLWMTSNCFFLFCFASNAHLLSLWYISDEHLAHSPLSACIPFSFWISF